MIGKVFNNRYQIQEKLGAGGTAIVYRGQDLLLNRAVTIKILREEFANNGELVRRFRHEAQAVASLSHSNIVSVYDVGYEDNMHYIVMEFVEGESLKEYIKRKGPLRLSEACNIITQILAGVQHAHEHGIIHRDIKPHNILLGVDGRAKVTDFGIAVGMSDVTMTYNSTTRIMGSVHYISPEQVQGQAATDKSDIYSCGVVFYEMLTGRVPYQGETPISIAMQHVQGELALPNQVNPQVPASISYVVTRAMRRNPETRYDSAAEMADAVRAAYQSVQESEGDQVTDATISMRNPLKRKKDGKSVIIERAKDEEDDGETSRRFTPGRIALLALAVALVGAIIWMATQLTGMLIHDDTATVPLVTGLPQAEAEEALTAAGLVARIEYAASDTVDEGIVISQSVSDGQKVSKGREIEITVSSGAAKVEVPPLVGSSQRIAQLTLTNLGLNVEIDSEYNSEVDKDQVIMQSPEGGTQVEPGSTVKLLISLGEEPVRFNMINMVGLTQAEAQKYISDNKLNLASINRERSDEVEAGIVIGQTPGEGVSVASGDEVTLTVSEGPGPTLRSYVVNYRLPEDVDENGEAVELLHTVTITVDDIKGSREVFSQQLSGGSSVAYTADYYNRGVITLYVDGVEAFSAEVP
ncbi:MAG: Stk1 family PASTA domain-containing Ser/Thr kinase [Firmicutes bacterium]|nr:Stk1 family PASTA domain-containing Ser/Thr kinase [Bacillota bacterium]MBQ6607363.1 Stk1 family PASTA domain-containing Ser/Thr kinase [Bacillota bacterium]MBR0178935.1 Stk1 family PASTA domain-containing Ser/Thr kinase [Bacillota bacterium]